MGLPTTANTVKVPCRLFISALCQVKEEAKSRKKIEISPRFSLSNNNETTHRKVLRMRYL
jgi:hypothetical protein